MRFNIDILFIDDSLEVIEKIDNLKPGKVIFPVKGAKAVIEGKAGAFKMIEVGSKIKGPI